MSKIHWELNIEGNGIVDMDELEYIADKLIAEYRDKPIVIKGDSPLTIHGEIHQGGDVDDILKEYEENIESEKMYKALRGQK